MNASNELVIGIKSGWGSFLINRCICGCCGMMGTNRESICCQENPQFTDTICELDRDGALSIMALLLSSFLSACFRLPTTNIARSTELENMFRYTSKATTVIIIITKIMHSL